MNMILKLVVLMILVFQIIGCIYTPEREYVCPDDSIVSNPEDCSEIQPDDSFNQIVDEIIEDEPISQLKSNRNDATQKTTTTISPQYPLPLGANCNSDNQCGPPIVFNFCDSSENSVYTNISTPYCPGNTICRLSTNIRRNKSCEQDTVCIEGKNKCIPVDYDYYKSINCKGLTGSNRKLCIAQNEFDPTVCGFDRNILNSFDTCSSRYNLYCWYP